MEDRLWEEIRCVHVCWPECLVYLMCAQVPTEVRERIRSPGNWDYRRL